jgi:NADH oxidase (H2O-forming)
LPVFDCKATIALAKENTKMRETTATKKVSILYISPHGNTEHMAHAVARGAASDGVDVVSYHISYLSAGEVRTIMEEADALVFGIPTLANDIPIPMWDVLGYLSTVKLKTTIAGVFGSYGWNSEACKKTEERLTRMGLKLVGDGVRTTVMAQCHALGRAVADKVVHGD